MRFTSSRVNSPADEFPPRRNFRLLSLPDLIEARHHYHLHLAHQPLHISHLHDGDYQGAVEDAQDDWRNPQVM